MTTPARAESPTIRVATIGLTVIGLLAGGGIVFLAAYGRLVPEALTALAGFGGTAIGAMATLLTTLTPAPLPGGRRTSDTMPALPDVHTIPPELDEPPAAPAAAPVPPPVSASPAPPASPGEAA